MRAFQLLLCCAILSGCVRNPSPLPTSLSSGDVVPLQASQNPQSAIGSETGFRTLYRFKGAPDGSAPRSSLVALHGKLYGTTSAGGNPTAAVGGGGTVFEVSTSGVERVLYRFNGRPDGATPEAALVALDGKLYGTTRAGGHRNYAGTIFEVDTSGTERLV